MTSKNIPAIVITVVLLSVLEVMALAAQAVFPAKHGNIDLDPMGER